MFDFFFLAFPFNSTADSTGRNSAVPPTGGASKLKRTITLTGSGPAVGGNTAGAAGAGASKSGTGETGGGRDTFSELSKFHKAQVNTISSKMQLCCGSCYDPFPFFVRVITS